MENNKNRIDDNDVDTKADDLKVSSAQHQRTHPVSKEIVSSLH